MRPVEHAVELALDAHATEAVLACMARLEARGIASLRHGGADLHPHVSLTVATTGSLDDLARALATPSGDRDGDLGGGLATRVPALALSHVGAFLAPARVVFLGVTLHHALADLHATVLGRLAAAGIATRALYDRGRWVPHCTLAMHVDSLAASFGALEDVDLPIESTPGSIGIVEVPTGRLVATVA